MLYVIESSVAAHYGMISGILMILFLHCRGIFFKIYWSLYDMHSSIFFLFEKVPGWDL